MAEFKLVRKWFTDQSTIGDLYVDGAMQCFTLEKPWMNGANIPDKSAIPEGTYSLSVTFSNRFQRNMPLISGVPGRDGIRIHTGNTSVDSEGCIIVGLYSAPDVVWKSKLAFAALYPRIVEATKNGPVPFIVTRISEAIV